MSFNNQTTDNLIELLKNIKSFISFLEKEKENIE